MSMSEKIHAKMGISLKHPYSLCFRMFTLTSSPSKEQRSTSFGSLITSPSPSPSFVDVVYIRAIVWKQNSLFWIFWVDFANLWGTHSKKKQTPSYLAAKKQWKTRCHSKFQSGGIIYITQNNSVEPFRQIINDQLYLKKGYSSGNKDG